MNRRTTILAVAIAAAVLGILIMLPARRPVRAVVPPPPPPVVRPPAHAPPVFDETFGDESDLPPVADVTPIALDDALAAAREATDFRTRRGAFATVEVSIRSLEDVTEGLKAWDAMTNIRDRDALLLAVMRAWARLAPEAAARWVLESTDSLSVARLRLSLLQTVLDTWARDDARAAYAFASRLPNKQDVERLLPQLLSSWASREPQAVAAALGAGELDGGTGTRVWNAIVRAWARDDAEGAIAFLGGLPADHPAQRYWTYAIASLAGADPARALIVAGGLGDAVRAQARAAVLKTWAAKSPDDAYNYLLAHPDVAALPGAIADVAAALIGTRPRDALQLLNGITDPNLLRSAVYRTLYSWAAKDPLAAWQYAQDLPADHPGHRLAANLLTRVAGAQRGEALRLAEATIDTAERVRRVQGVVQAWAREDPSAAWTYLAGQTDPAFEATRINVLTMLAAKGEPARALELAATVAEGKVRDSLYRGILQAWASRDPSAALANLPAGMDPTIAQQVIQTAVMRVAGADPGGAIALARDIADAAVRKTVLTSAFQYWVRIDPIAALEAARATPEVDMDAIRGQAVASLAEVDFDRALREATAIEAPANREAAIQSLASRWADMDPAASLTWYTAEADAKGGAYAVTLRGMLEKWAWQQKDGYTASADWILRQGVDHPTEVLNVFVERLARSDVDAAWQYAQSLPNDESGAVVRQTAYGMAIRELARTDGRKAAEWLAQAQDYTPDQRVLSEVVFNWAKQEPVAAAEWVSQFPPDHPGRMAAIADVAYQWSQVDPKAAQTWRKHMTRPTPPPTP